MANSNECHVRSRSAREIAHHVGQLSAQQRELRRNARAINITMAQTDSRVLKPRSTVTSVIAL